MTILEQQSQIDRIKDIHSKVFGNGVYAFYFQGLFYPSELSFEYLCNGEKKICANPNVEFGYYLPSPILFDSLTLSETEHWLDGLKKMLDVKMSKDKKYNIPEQLIVFCF